MGKKSKRIRTKQTKEENDKAKNVMVINRGQAHISGQVYMSKKTKKFVNKWKGGVGLENLLKPN